MVPLGHPWIQLVVASEGRRCRGPARGETRLKEFSHQTGLSFGEGVSCAFSRIPCSCFLRKNHRIPWQSAPALMTHINATRGPGRFESQGAIRKPNTYRYPTRPAINANFRALTNTSTASLEELFLRRPSSTVIP